jgi:hypothetical protein
MLFSWHETFLEDIRFGIFRRPAEALDLEMGRALGAETIEPYAVLFQQDQSRYPGTQTGDLLFGQPAFEDRVLDRVPKSLSKCAIRVRWRSSGMS